MAERRTHENSREAYEAIVGDLPAKRAAVLARVRSSGSYGLTRQNLAASLCLPINTVTGRVRELIDMGLLAEVGTTKVRGKSRAVLVAVDPENYRGPRHKPETAQEKIASLEARITELEKQREHWRDVATCLYAIFGGGEV